jgi:hypothetical protein
METEVRMVMKDVSHRKNEKYGKKLRRKSSGKTEIEVRGLVV